MKGLLSKQLNLFVSVTVLLFCGLQLPAYATVHNVQTSCGATGNGSTDDTAAIKTCISQLVSGDTLEFPAGTYRVSSQLSVNVSNVTIDGSNKTATILNTQTGSGATGLLVGKNGIANTNSALGSAVALSAAANELATSFSTVSSLGASAGSYVYLQQGGEDSSQGSGNTGCDPSGCRGEVVQIASVSGNTYTVTTALHDTFNPSLNGATARLVSGMLTGITIQNINFDGNGTVTYGVAINDVANSSITSVTTKNVQGSALISSVSFGLSINNLTVSRAGSEGCGAAVSLYLSGNLTGTGISLSGLNPGTSGSGCLLDGAFGFALVEGANGTIQNLTVDSAGTGGGRPMKLTSSRYNTFDSLTVKNGCCAFNGLSLEYYSSHNTFNSCTITDNGGSGTGNGNAGINSFGNFNQYNAFNQCTVTGNGNVQILVNNFDAMRLGQDSNDTFNGTTVGGPGTGFLIEASSACVNNNVLQAGSGLNTGISVMNTTNVGAGNVLNGYSSNLASGTCGSSAAPAPPTGLSAVVQ